MKELLITHIEELESSLVYYKKFIQSLDEDKVLSTIFNVVDTDIILLNSKIKPKS